MFINNIYLFGRSLLIKACTCGYAPKRHPQTSRMAFGYFDSLDSSVFPSSVQQFLQLPEIICLSWMSNLWISSQEEHNRVGLLKPRARHSSKLWIATDSITNWVNKATVVDQSIMKSSTTLGGQPGGVFLYRTLMVYGSDEFWSK